MGLGGFSGFDKANVLKFDVLQDKARDTRRFKGKESGSLVNERDGECCVGLGLNSCLRCCAVEDGQAARFWPG